MSAPDSAPLRRQLSLLDCFGIGINGILGSGIFLLPAALWRCAGGRAPLAWLLAGGFCCLVALCFAEAAARTDRSGGPYRYACDAFGPYVGFAVGWITVISTLLGYAAVARGFGQNAAAVLGGSGRAALELSLGGGMVLFLGAVNLLGVRSGARMGDGVSFVKVASLLLFVGVGLFFVDWGHLAEPPPLPRDGERGGLLGAAFVGLFAVTGFEYIPVPAGETLNPRRAVPLSMVVSVLAATLLYALVQVVADGTTPGPGLAQSGAALADSAYAFGGARGRTLMGLAGVVSAFGFCASSALVGPRYLESFAQDRFLPRVLAYRSPRLGTPVAAIAVLSLLVALPLFVGQRFENLANMSNVAVVMQYVATCAAVLVLRRRQPAPAGAFVVPFGPLVPVLALLGSGVFLWYVWCFGRRDLLWAAGFIVAGLGLGALVRRGRAY